jgi:hypothetical protein
VGTWLELAAQEGAPVRAKLSWRSSVSDLCVLVDRRGGKVLDIDLGELAELIQAGRARIVAGTDVPLVDRALDVLMQTLRGSRSAPPGAA